ncbi:allatotropins-like [Culicoides brevitarsis]|uniref:allatotropins-like n=1 Tax=Culicoides brevitarsis TaxID=469753 RepID=UPI00307C7987
MALLYNLMTLSVVSTILLQTTCYAGPAGQIALAAARASKVPRSIRASFRNPEIGVARGFGKRSQTQAGQTSTSELPWSYSRKEDAKWLEDVEEHEPFQQLLRESPEGIPVDWLAGEMASNPYLARAILRRLVDLNRDGYLSALELMSPISLVDGNVVDSY